MRHHTSAKSFRLSQHFVPALMLSGLLLFGASLLPSKASQAVGSGLSRVSQMGRQARPQRPVAREIRTGELPPRVANRVKREHAHQTGTPRQTLSVTSYQAETWPDGCLGLAREDEMCTLALVEGWRVEVSDGTRSQIYRTDARGGIIRMEESTDPETLPAVVRDRILQAAASESGIPVANLRVVEAESRVWSGCLGIDPGPDGFCTRIALFGWQTIVAGNGQSWIYHATQDGSQILLNQVASPGSSPVVPTFIEPPAFDNSGDVVFQATTSGGFAGLTETIQLLQDGRIIRRDRASSGSPVVIRQVSPAEVEAFVRLLQEQRLMSFNQIGYPAPAGSADYQSVMLSAGGAHTQYVDFVQADLPPALQRVIEAWDRLVAAR